MNTQPMHHRQASAAQKLATPDFAQVRLTKREMECLTLLSRGYRNSRISERLGIAMPTVELHILNARKKFGAKTREQLMARAIFHGIITL
ncbi:MAG: helix-turn-helix transcriptional regulator [Pseudomonadota bacterium]